MLDADSHKPELAEDEPDAKAILLELRSVKKQFPISSYQLRGDMMSDTVAILGSFDFVMGECDR